MIHLHVRVLGQSLRNLSVNCNKYPNEQFHSKECFILCKISFVIPGKLELELYNVCIAAKWVNGFSHRVLALVITSYLTESHATAFKHPMRFSLFFFFFVVSDKCAVIEFVSTSQLNYCFHLN